jgi:SnoaL-like domain
MASTDQFSLVRAADRMEIQHRIHQFCRAVDRLDLEALHEVFHPDAHDDHGVFKGGPDGFIDWARGRHKTIEYSSHHMTNVYIEFVEDDEAFAETYFFIWQSVTPAASIMAGSSDDDSPYEMISSGRYVDRFTRRDGQWKIQERTVVPGSMMRVPEQTPMALADGFVKYTRDEQDFAQQLRAQMGIK